MPQLPIDYWTYTRLVKINILFKEEEFKNLQDLRLHTQKGNGLSLTNKVKSWFGGDHSKVRALFATDRIPVLTPSEEQAFKALKPEDQLEYINEWVSRHLKNALNVFEVKFNAAVLHDSKILSLYLRKLLTDDTIEIL